MQHAHTPKQPPPRRPAPPSGKTRLQVAQVITRLDLGGAQISTLHLLRGLDRDRFDVHLVCGTGGLLDPTAAALPRTTMHRVPELVRPISPLRDARAVGALVKIFRRLRIDVVHTHSSKAGILGRLAARMAGVPRVVHTIHGFAFHPYQHPVSRWAYRTAERLAARSTDRLVAVCRSDIEKGLAARVGERGQYVMIHDPFDPLTPGCPGIPGAAPREDEFGRVLRTPVVLMAACLKAQKNPLAFVEIARLVHAREPAARFLVAGDGPLRKAFEAEVARHGLSPFVETLGWVYPMRPLLAGADALVLPSFHEGLPLTVVEALALGLPVVASRVDGIPEVIEDGRNGFLCNPGRPDEFADRVLTILAGRAGLEPGRVPEGFGLEANLRRIEALYQ